MMPSMLSSGLLYTFFFDSLFNQFFCMVCSLVADPLLREHEDNVVEPKVLLAVADVVPDVVMGKLCDDFDVWFVFAAHCFAFVVGVSFVLCPHYTDLIGSVKRNLEFF